jgi:predicted membrane protein
MGKRGEINLGVVLVVLGALFLIGNIFHIDFDTYCWPVGLIAIGAWLLLRPQLTQGSQTSDVVVLGDLRRNGAWKVEHGEIWMGVGDINLDFTQAEIPAGETRLRIYGFVGDIDLVFPAQVGVSISASGFVVDANLFGRSQQTFLNPIQFDTPNYSSAECRVRVEVVCFVTDIKAIE